MSGLLRGIARIRTAPVLRGSNITQRANITSKAAEGSMGVKETTIGLTLFFLTLLVPSGWFLAKVDNYKQKQ